jgi:catecholate siderophore receptor
MAYIRNTKHGKAVRTHASIHSSLHLSIHSSIAASALALSLSPGQLMAQQTGGQTLPHIEVSGQQAAEGFKADQASSPKFAKPLLDTPQTVVVIKKELMNQRVATSLTEALRNTPGVGTFNVGENGNSQSGDAIYMRGVSSANSIFVDNIRDTAAITRDMFNIERVEVIKGAGGPDNGRGSAAGYINLETKLPHLENAAALDVSYGSGNQKRLTADLNRVIDAELGSAFRLNLLKQESGVPGRHRVRNNRWGFAPSYSFGLGTPTRVHLYYAHVQQDNIPDAGVPTVGLPGFYDPRATGKRVSTVDSGNFYGAPTDRNTVRSDTLSARIEHDFSADLKLRNISRYGATSQFQRLAAPFFSSAAAYAASLNLSSPNPANWTVWRLPQVRDVETESWVNQTSLSARFATGAVRHTLITGVDFSRESARSWGYSGTGYSASDRPVNLYSPDTQQGLTRSSARNGSEEQGRTNTAGVYLFDTLDLTPSWQLAAGARLDRYRTRYQSRASDGTTEVVDKSGSLLNWKASALFKPAPEGSVYVAYGTSQLPPGGSSMLLNTSTTRLNADSPRFDPQKTSTVEVGTKWDVLDRKLALTAALFRTTVTNEIKQDATDASVYVQTGKKRMQGLELGVVGNITPAWSISSGLAIVNTKVIDGGKSESGAALNWSPRLSFTSWSSYRVGGLTLGGGARYVDSMTRQLNNAVGATTNMPGVQSYWIVDAMASYEINPHATLQLNVNNLMDKRYIGALNNSGARYIPGEARSALLSLNLKY